MNDDGHSSPFGPDAFTRMWSDFATQMMQNGMGFSPDRATPAAAKDMRNAMFRAWGEYCDQFMRSGEFLEMMKESLSASVQARKQLNDFLGQMQHEFQGASRQDVDQIMLSLRHMERRVVDDVERLSQDVADLGERLEKMEQKLSGNEKNSKAKKTGGKKKAAEEDDD